MLLNFIVTFFFDLFRFLKGVLKMKNFQKKQQAKYWNIAKKMPTDNAEDMTDVSLQEDNTNINNEIPAHCLLTKRSNS